LDRGIIILWHLDKIAGVTHISDTPPLENHQAEESYAGG
jgi:hypothetical protein